MKVNRSANPNDVAGAWKEAAGTSEGIERINLARSWADNPAYSGRFYVEQVDDDVNAGAVLVFITHERDSDMDDPNGLSWNGVTVEYISQWKPVAEFWLYPEMVDGLLSRLNKLRNQALIHASGRMEHGLIEEEDGS